MGVMIDVSNKCYSSRSLPDEPEGLSEGAIRGKLVD
jgi:hypothetical protein